MIKHIKGDITTVKRGVILHGVNLQGAMGSGVALALCSKWPQVRRAYMKLFKQTEVFGCSKVHLGQVQYVGITHHLRVANGLTQEFYGRSGKRYACPEAIEKCIDTVCANIRRMSGCKTDDESVLHMPLIGGDLGGLDFNSEVLPRIERMAAKYPDVTIKLWHYEP